MKAKPKSVKERQTAYQKRKRREAKKRREREAEIRGWWNNYQWEIATGRRTA